MKTDKKPWVRIVVFAAALVVFCTVAGISGRFADFSSFAQSIRLVSADALLNLVIMAAAVLLITNLLGWLLSSVNASTGRGRTLLSISASALRYIGVLVVIIWGLVIIGVDISTVFASVGILALIIGFGAESLIADVITGAFMLFENQYNVGDIIEVGGFRGTVCKIGIRTTCVKDLGDNVKVINNSEMKNILNRSDELSRAVCDFPVSYNDDLTDIEKKLDAVLERMPIEYPDVFRSKPRYVGVQSLLDSSVVLRIVAEVEEKNIYSGVRILNRSIMLGLAKDNIRVPFPQMDIHCDDPSVGSGERK